ncbi:hypothetical protein KB206_00280 [Microvirga sp. STS02]|uniref:hypothetical protein n=1 Tax=Hymenobacter negativus TaxID=2795026 RepID=UPI0018DB0E20|nr:MULTISPECIES: hypothetical protein [Bacteria]MBH8567301.1 hypothetical protein [Hymenobacter negativus]MBR7207033.1 hypothetical protein [Microvirga sp. STS02]
MALSTYPSFPPKVNPGLSQIPFPVDHPNISAAIELMREVGEAAAKQKFDELVAGELRAKERQRFVNSDEAALLMGGCSRFTLAAWRKKGLLIGKRIKGQRGGFHYQVGSIEDAVAANSIRGSRKWARKAKTKSGQGN